MRENPVFGPSAGQDLPRPPHVSLARTRSPPTRTPAPQHCCTAAPAPAPAPSPAPTPTAVLSLGEQCGDSSRGRLFDDPARTIGTSPDHAQRGKNASYPTCSNVRTHKSGAAARPEVRGRAGQPGPTWAANLVAEWCELCGANDVVACPTGGVPGARVGATFAQAPPQARLPAAHRSVRWRRRGPTSALSAQDVVRSH